MTLVIDPPCHTTCIKIPLKQYISKKENKYNANSNSPTKSAIESKEIITGKRNDNKIKETAPKLNHPIVAKPNYPQLLSITDDNWESEVPWSQDIITIPEPMEKGNLQNYYKFAKHSLENDFFGSIWFEKNGICETLEFYPNQIDWLSTFIKNGKYEINSFLVKERLQVGTIHDNFMIGSISHINETALSIFHFIFETNNDWLSYVKKNLHLSLRSRYLLNPLIGQWYEHVKQQKLWDKREFWTCRMWVVWLVLFLIQQLICDRVKQLKGKKRKRMSIEDVKLQDNKSSQETVENTE